MRLAAIWLIAIPLAAVLGPAVLPYSQEQMDLTARLAPPSVAHLLGTDEVGRDVLVRLLYGARFSILLGLAAAAISVLVGTVLGLISGYGRTAVDSILMRVTDGFLAPPTFFLLLAALTTFGTHITTIVLVIASTSWMSTARLVRSEVLKTRGEVFVEAARLAGASTPRIMLRHVLPQAVPSIAVATSLSIAQAILIESALSYLGLGVQPPTPSWGNMLSASQNYVFTAPLLAVYPGLLILFTVLSFDGVGEQLLVKLDPLYGRAHRERIGVM
jgi:peptide/nickel transport system permease protein